MIIAIEKITRYREEEEKKEDQGDHGGGEGQRGRRSDAGEERGAEETGPEEDKV